MQCQRKINHHSPYTHPMSDTEEQCKRKATAGRAITSGKVVSVCAAHKKEVEYRMEGDFYKTPDEFFVWAKA